MTRRNPERPPGPSYYRLPEASWTMIRDEYLSGWTAKEIAEKWRVSPTSVYRHASDGGWNKYARGQAFHDQVVAEARQAEAAAPSYAAPQYAAPRRAAPLFEDLDLPRMWREEDWARRREEEAQDREARRRRYDPDPSGYGPTPNFVPKEEQERPRRDAPPQPLQEAPPALPPAAPPAAPDLPPAQAAERLAAAAAKAALEGRYDDAHKLARLAESLKKLSGGQEAAKKAEARPAFEDEDPYADALSPEDRPLNCTARTCAMKRVEAVLQDRLLRLSEACDVDRAEDVVDWVDMATAIGAKADPELEALAQGLRAEGLDTARKILVDLLGPRPPEGPRMEFDHYR